MSDPRRYLEGDPQGLAARLLASASADGPSARSLQRALATAAVASAAATAAKTSTAAASVGLLLKWIGVGVVVGTLGLVGGELLLGQGGAPASAPGEASAAPPASAAPEVTSPAAPEGAPVSPLAARPLERSWPRSSAAPPRANAEPAPTGSASLDSAGPGSVSPDSVSPDSLREELAHLDAARRHLTAGEPGPALQELKRYAERYPHGRLLHEAALLHAEALALQGDCAQVRALAQQVGDGGVLARRWATLRERCP